MPEPDGGEWFVKRQFSYSVTAESAQRMLWDIFPETWNLLENTYSKQISLDAITYRSVTPDGKSTIVSGLVVYPLDIPVRGTVVELHGTILSADEAPTRNVMQPGVLFAFLGYAVFIPDLIGFGVSADLPHPYLHAVSTGRIATDMVFAGREYLKKNGIDTSGPLYAEGYSQGGHGALAFQRYAESNRSGQIGFEKVYAGGGPYDLAATFDYFARTGCSPYPCSIPYCILGMNYAQRLDLDLTQIFCEPLLSAYPTWFFGREYDATEVNGLLGPDLSGFMHPDFFLPGRNAEINRFYSALRENSLLEWTPCAPIRLLHAKEDTVVPYLNATNAFEAFKSAGCDVKLRTWSGGDDGVDHEEMFINYYLELFDELK